MSERVDVLASAPFVVAVSNNDGTGQNSSFSLHVTAAGLALPNGTYRLCDAAAVAELVEAVREYDEALAPYAACAPVRPWHSSEVAAELAGYRSKARARLKVAKARRAAAIARVGPSP